MQKFEEKKFNIGILKGISAKNIEEHLKLYAGYVKNANLIQNMIEQYAKIDDEGGKYSVAEITRRFGFEFNGMRNHEYYFDSLSGGAKELKKEGELKKTNRKRFWWVRRLARKIQNPSHYSWRRLGYALL